MVLRLNKTGEYGIDLSKIWNNFVWRRYSPCFVAFEWISFLFSCECFGKNPDASSSNNLQYMIWWINNACRYIGKPLQSGNSTSPSTCNQQKDQETDSEKQQSNHVLDYNSDTHGPTTTSFQPGLREMPIPYPQQREISQPIPVRGVSFENLINGFSPMMPQMYRVPSGLSPLPSPSAASYPRPFTQVNPFYPSDCQPSNSPKFNGILDQRFGNVIDQTDNKHVQKLEILENQSHASSANEQTGNSSFYNSHTSHHYSVGPSSNGKIHSISLPMPIPECGNEDGLRVQEGTNHRSIQREVALTKFRMKRKERCFEKKVGWHSHYNISSWMLALT